MRLGLEGPRRGRDKQASDGGDVDGQVRKGAVELPDEAADLVELERALIAELDGTVMPAIDEVDKVRHCPEG